jgi:hypothetical protein
VRLRESAEFPTEVKEVLAMFAGVQPLPAPVYCPRVGHDAYLEVRDVTQGLMATQETPFASDLIEE